MKNNIDKKRMPSYNFSHLKAGIRLQVIFAVSTTFIFGLIFLSSMLSAIWFENLNASYWESEQLSRIAFQFTSLGELQSDYLTLKFRSYIDFVVALHTAETAIIYDPPLFIYNPPVKGKTIPVGQAFYNTGCYFSSLDQSEQGLLLMQADAGMDLLYPLIYIDEMLSIYAGFFQDQTIHMFPCNNSLPDSYTPVVREWFYQAINSPSQVIITEPYIDASTSEWVITLSKALNDPVTQETIGTCAIDIMLTSVAEHFQDVSIFNTGFYILISRGGIVLNNPKVFTYSSLALLHIFDESVTGINEELWNQFIANNEEQISQFTVPSGEVYYINVHKITPFDNKTIVTQYLAIAIKVSELTSTVDLIHSKYSSARYLIFQYLLGILLAGVIINTLVVYLFSKKFTNETAKIIELLKSTFEKVLSIERDPSKVIEYPSEKILYGVGAKFIKEIKEINEFETQYSKNFNKQRPVDKVKFDKWKKKLYPINCYNDKQLKWRKEFTKLKEDLPGPKDDFHKLNPDLIEDDLIEDDIIQNI